MKNQIYKLGIVLTSVACVFLFANCVQDPVSGELIPGKVTGGGRIDVLGGGMANFGFNASGCDDPEEPTGRFNYHDMQGPGPGGVRLIGTIIEAYQCEPGGDDCEMAGQEGNYCPAGAYVVAFGYRSTNPKQKGVGFGGACLVDNGEGHGAEADLVGLALEDGPYDTYQVQGSVRGNIQAHPCPIEIP